MDYVQVIIWVIILSWDAMLNMTKVELKLIPNPAIYMLFKKGTRGGISYISIRYSEANN